MAEVTDVMAMLRLQDAEDADRFLKYPEMIRLEKFAERLSYGPKEINLTQRIAGIKAALELADHLGSPAARYLYGTTLLAGRLGMTNLQEANKQFELGVKKISAAVNKGDPRATFYYGLMVNGGYGGVEKNLRMSSSMIKQVMTEVPTTDLLRLQELIADGTFIQDDSDLLFGESVIKALINRGEQLAWHEIFLVCAQTRGDKVDKCVDSFKVGSPKKDRRVEIPTSATAPPSVERSRVTADREKQDFTGYIKDTPQGASGGRSIFTMDNSRGGSDAIGRLYLNGAKPAVRSMYVKAGEAFRAQSLSAGSYVFRYRFIGSDTTYEADRQVVLSETQTETGIRYSTVTITLFKEVGGNLTVKKVSPDDF